MITFTKSHRRAHWPLCLLGILAVSLLNAQNGAEEQPIIKADFTVYSLERLSGLNYLQGDRVTGTAINFFSSSRSPVYEYEGVNPIVFFTEEADPTAVDTGGIRRRAVAQVNLPMPGGRYLFIFFRDTRTDGEEYLVYPLPDSTRDLPFGTIRFFNATPFTLEGLVGGDRVQFTPGPSQHFRVSGGKLSVALGFSHEGKFHRSFNSPLDLESDARGLLMIFPPFVKGSAILQTRYLRDHDQPKETPATRGITNASF